MKNEEIYKRMHDINTFQSFEGEVFLCGKDEFGNDFTIVFGAYEFISWIGIDELARIKSQLKIHIDKNI